MNTFQQDLLASHKREMALEAKLQQQGYTTSNTSHLGAFADYDVSASLPGQPAITYEVKYDAASQQYGNVAVEYSKVTVEGKQAASGVLASKADYQCYTFPNDDNFYCIPTGKLRLMLMQPGVRYVNGGDGGRARLALICMKDFVSQATQL